MISRPYGRLPLEAPPPECGGIRPVGSEFAWYLAESYLSDAEDLARASYAPDFFISTTRWHCPEYVPGQEILRVAHNIFVREKLNLILVGPFTPEIKGQLEKEIESF